MFAFPAEKRYDSQVEQIVKSETWRQWANLIFIPSETICHPECQQILASPFTNVYAEGQPEPPLLHDPRESATDKKRFDRWQTRLGDSRFYRGCVDANRVELLAQKNIAVALSKLKDSPPAQDIFVCVQALSGAPANTAVYEALLEHGDALLGLDLAHGGHLTHGSQFNYSGKTFKCSSYGIIPETRHLDYDNIRSRAREHRPKLIIGGASSYPWDINWAELRSIADEVGAYLLADVAHLAGMITAGLLNNPVPYAHVVTFTTHKTLCGPRGAAIITTYPKLNQKLRAGVFPGMQGGPHVHTIAAIARLFEIINNDRETFVRLQQTILDNTAHFARCLKDEGFELEYGGTNTHLLLVDLRRWSQHPNSAVSIDGEIASRLLELAGIVCNKNVLPGDETGGKASGIRLGMPWLTQRGITREHIRQIASVMKLILSNIETLRVWVPAGEERCRGKIRNGVLDEAARRVRQIVEALPYPARPAGAEKPKFTMVNGNAAMLLRGDNVKLALNQMLTCPVMGLAEGEAATGQLLRSDGTVIDDAIAVNLGLRGREEVFALLVHEAKLDEVARWITELSDGYLLFDHDDLYAKVDGPTVVEPLPQELVSRIPANLPAPETGLTKPYFIGQRVKYQEHRPEAKKPYHRTPPDLPLQKTVLNEAHEVLGAKMVPFAGWEMPVQYPEGIFAEHRAVRTAAGLFDVSHMSLFEVSGKFALPFLDTLLANCVSRLGAGEAQYTYLLGANGIAIDDMYVYRMERDRFMLVANAANAERDWDWIQAVNSRRFIIDMKMPAKQIDGAVTIRNLRDDGLLGLALQGPVSAKLLCHLAKKSHDRFALDRLVQNKFVPANVAGIDIIVARTGYTGEEIGFEVYVHPSRCVALWNALLEEGRKYQVKPTGLGARDSTRTEAGFPLFGHELEGDCELSLTEAGYGFVTRFHVPFFIGRETYLERVHKANRQVVRLMGQGRKSVRQGHAVIDATGTAIGQITSFAYTKPDFTFFALAAVEKGFRARPGEKLCAVREAADKYQPPANPDAVVELEILTRFPDDAERAGWPKMYE